MTNLDENITLVLSIFKGENFVNKNPGGLRCQIEARCNGETLESGVIFVSSSNSEPVFNSQLAWRFTRRDLKQIRINKEIVKVRCLILNADSKHPTELGYAVLYVQDAFRMSAVTDVDPSKALSYPLLGTKEQWKIFHPKLIMQLHLEEPAQSRSIADNLSLGVTRKTNIEPSAKNEVGKKLSLSFIDSASRSELMQDKIANDRFSWHINEENGCFLLGNSSERDDLYILNITIISASFLHLLWNNRSPKKASSDDYVWQVKYKAYGCEIKSDPFVLSHDDDVSRRTFIGDKATARIRANGAVFFEYLQETAVEFHIVRFQLSENNELMNEEVMGVSVAELKDLAKPDIAELKSTLEIVSEWGYRNVIDYNGKPEIRVVFQLDAVPEYFSSGTASKNTRTGELDYQNNIQEIENDDQRCLDSMPKESPANPDLVSDSLIEKLKELEIAAGTKVEVPKTPIIESPARPMSSTPREKIKSKPSTAENRRHQLEEDWINSESQASAERSRVIETTPRVMRDSRFESSSASSSSNTSHRSKSESSESLTSPEKEQVTYPDDFVTSGSETSDKENLEGMTPSPGAFEITIGLTKFWLKSSSQMRKIIVSYNLPQFGIVEDPVICTAKRSSDVSHKKPNYQLMVVEDGVSTMKVSIPKFSETILNEPMTVQFRQSSSKFLDPTFGFSLVPIGSALLQQERNGNRQLKGFADILKCGTNIKLGVLHYYITFTTIDLKKSPLRRSPKTFHSVNQSNEPYRPFRNENKKEDISERPINPALVCRTIEELTAWKMEQEHIFLQKKEQKERDYLRIVAEEVAKRDLEREQALNVKLAELKKKDKELNQLTRRVTEREDQLKYREDEVSDAARRLAQEQSSALENSKLSIRRIQEEFQIEASSLKRRITEYEAELEKLKGKLTVLESKIEEKDDLIRRLRAESHERPDFRLSEKMKLLEQENKLLKKQVADTERSRDQYKKQSQTLCHKLGRLQEDKDKQLKDENENLRLQILASKEHKELKKERKAVADLSQTIRVLQDSAKTKTSTEPSKPRLSDQKTNKRRNSDSQAAKEEEIARLTQMRSGLLSTGAYTQYDMVIKEMERKIVSLANNN